MPAPPSSPTPPSQPPPARFPHLEAELEKTTFEDADFAPHLGVLSNLLELRNSLRNKTFASSPGEMMKCILTIRDAFNDLYSIERGADSDDVTHSGGDRGGACRKRPAEKGGPRLFSPHQVACFLHQNNLHSMHFATLDGKSSTMRRYAHHHHHHSHWLAPHALFLTFL